MTQRKTYLTTDEIDYVTAQVNEQLRIQFEDFDVGELAPTVGRATIRITWEVLRDSFGATVAVRDE